MYKPKFNSVLVEIEQDKWGKGNDDSMLGVSYSRGKFISMTELIRTHEYDISPIELNDFMLALVGRDIMWNEGTEAGTTFEHGGKLYGFIYWFDIRGVKE